MKFFLLFAALTSFGATSTFARNINNNDAKLRQFFHLLDKNGNKGVSLEEIKEKLNETDYELGGPGTPASSMVAVIIPSIDMTKDYPISLADIKSILDPFLEQGFARAIEMLDKNNDSQISESEISILADLIPRIAFPMPLDQCGSSCAIFDTNMDSQISFDEFKNIVEELSKVVVGLLDRNGDGKVSLDEVKENAKAVIQKAINIMDLDGDDKLSAQELTNAISTSTLSKAFMNLLDVNEDGEVRFEELQSLETQYGNTLSLSAVRAELNWYATAWSDAIRGTGNP